MSISSKYTNIIIISSLFEDESQTGKRLCENLQDLEGYEDSPTTPLTSFERVGSVKELERVLDKILNQAKAEPSFKPRLHFDMHGCKEGVELRKGKESDKKSELYRYKKLCKKLREINKATHFNLVVVMAVCMGNYILVGNISLRERFFARAIIGSSQKVYNENLDNYYKMYKELSKLEMTKALKCIPGNDEFKKLSVFTAERTYSIALSTEFKVTVGNIELHEEEREMLGLSVDDYLFDRISNYYNREKFFMLDLCPENKKYLDVDRIREAEHKFIAQVKAAILSK